MADAEQAIEAAPPAPSPPPRFMLVYAHGFVDANDRHHYWKAGDIVSDPAEVAMLKKRGADLEQIA